MKYARSSANIIHLSNLFNDFGFFARMMKNNKFKTIKIRVQKVKVSINSPYKNQGKVRLKISNLTKIATTYIEFTLTAIHRSCFTKFSFPYLANRIKQML